MSGVTPSSCPGALLLFQYANGNLEWMHRERIASHIAACPQCSAKMSQAARGQPAFDGRELADALEPRARAARTAPGPVLRVAAPPVPDEDAFTHVHHPTNEDAPTRMHAGTSGFGTPGAVLDDDSATSVVPSSETFPSHPSDTGFGPDVPGEAGRLRRGTAVGRYLIVEPLGSGGLGDVYTAYDPELDRRVAIKLLRPTADKDGSSEGGSSGSERLVREAKAMARVAHPNVVAVHDVGRVADGVFIAMERVSGITLSTWMREQQHTWQEVRDVFLGAGAGLAAAHAVGIVHRDFKPQNVIIGGDGRPRVLDFGLARSVHRDQRSGLLKIFDIVAVEAEASNASLEDPITLPGTMMGTPQFMAPEQFEGAEAGPAADQFSFCVALWNALYGERPFQGDGIPGLMKVVREGRITEPSDRRGVPKWLHRVLLRGLSRDPERRYGGMDAVLHALQRDLRSRKRNFVMLGLVALLSAGGAGGAAYHFRPKMTEQHRSAIESLAEEARGAAAKGYFVYPAPDDPDAVTGYRKVLELEDQDGPSEEPGEQSAAELRTEFAATLTRLGDTYYDREGGRAFAADYYAAALIFDPDDEHARSRTTLTPGELSSLRDKAAIGEFSESELAAAASLEVLALEDQQARIEQLTALYSGDNAPSPSTSARLEALLGGAEAQAIEAATVRRHAKKGKAKNAPSAAAAPPMPEYPPRAPEPAAQDDESEARVAGASVPSEEPVGQADPGRARDLAKEGIAEFKKGRFAQAEALLHRSLAHKRHNATALGALAELYFEQGSYQKAVQFAAKAVSLAPRSGKYRIILGDAYFKTLAYASARREYEKAKELGHGSAGSRLVELDKRLGK